MFNIVLTGFIFFASLLAVIDYYIDENKFNNSSAFFRILMIAGTICAGILFLVALFEANDAEANEIVKTDWTFYTVFGDENGGAYYTESDYMMKEVKDQKVGLSVAFICDKRKPSPLYTLLTLTKGHQFGDMNVVFDVDDKRLNNGPAENPRLFSKFPGQYSPKSVMWPNPYTRNVVDKIVNQTDLRIVWNEISLNDRLYITVNIDDLGPVEFSGTHNMGSFDPADVINRCQEKNE